MKKHQRWDPICVRFREPRNRFERWIFDRNRGRGCWCHGRLPTC